MIIKIVLLYLKLFPPKRVKFKQWSELEDLSKIVIDAADGDKDINLFSVGINRYLTISLKLPYKILSKLPWNFVIPLFYLALELNKPNKIPLLVSGSNDKDSTVSWDYPGRNWHYWAHLFAKNYGWSLEYISNLDVDTALSQAQEIVVDKQLDREFTWSTTEIAYPYNSVTKKSKFSPLNRPSFMFEKVKALKIIRIPKMLMPQGLVKDVSGMDRFVQEEIKNQKIKSGRDDASLQDD